MLKEKVTHRIGDLENMSTLIAIRKITTYRIGDLENIIIRPSSKLRFTHRIGDLGMNIVVVIPLYPLLTTTGDLLRRKHNQNQR